MDTYTRRAATLTAALMIAGALAACGTGGYSGAEPPEGGADVGQEEAEGEAHALEGGADSSEEAEPESETVDPEDIPGPEEMLDGEVPEPVTYQPGDTFQYADWELELGETDTDATQEVIDSQLAEYDNDPEYTTPPADGNVYITVPVAATYTGADYDDPAISLNFAYVSADGNTYAEISTVSAPTDLGSVGDLYPGGSGKGEVLQEVPAEDAEGGSWRITWNSMDSTGDEVYVAAVGD